jgi:hypothetical protein
MAKNPHRWRFHRVGGLEQVSLATADDLEELGKLDQKLWTALSCPTRGLELDPRTLDLLDADRDGRVRARDVVAAVEWCKPRLRTLDELVPGTPDLPLSALDAETSEGVALLGAARQILAARGKPGAESIAPADVADVSHVFDSTLFNGDGVIVPASAEGDAEVATAIADAIACAGSVPDRSGLPGIDRKRIDAFFGDLEAYAAWWDAAPPGAQALGPATPAAWKAVSALRTKVEDYFTRCRLAAVDPRGSAILNRSDAELAAVAARDLSGSPAELAALPIARVESGRALPLAQGVNPAWAAAVSALAADAVAPAFGARTVLTVDDWAALVTRLAPYDGWQAGKKGAATERLGIDRVRALLAGGIREKLEALLARDLKLEPEAQAIGGVVKMVHYHRDLHTLLRNFVSFSNFYDPARSAVFQAGTLYLDARSCDLCVRVEDPAAHATLGSLSRMFIAYCDCRRADGASMKIAACFTQGDSDYLMVGRNGVFYDRQGRDWDATIVKIVENPISIRQAFLAPYKKFLRLIEEQVARFAAAKDQESAARLAAAASGTVEHATGAAPAGSKAAQAMDIGKMVGIIAAIGVGAGALGTLLGGLVSGFLGLQPWWAKLLAIAGVLLVISGPSVVIAGLKLRQRTLGPVLDANGWAVNGRVKVNLPLGYTLTARAQLPPGSIRSLKDPYEDKAAVRQRILLWAIVVVLAAALAAARWFGVWPFGPLPGK